MSWTDDLKYEIGEDNGVIVFDPSVHKKCGNNSVGVQRQWLGRLGKVDNGQVGVYMGYASRKEHALVDERLYLPGKRANNKTLRKKCGVPKNIRYKTRHELALEMLGNNGEYLLLRQVCDRKNHGWMGRCIRRKSRRRELARFYQS